MNANTLLIRTRLVLLAAWAGAMTMLGGIVVPAAFSFLPTQFAAGMLGSVFNQMDAIGAGTGLACLVIGALGLRGRRGALEIIRVALPLVGVLAHGLSYLWVSPQLSEIRLGAGGTIGQLPAGDPGWQLFEDLHHLSRNLFLVAACTPIVALLWDLVRRPEAKS